MPKRRGAKRREFWRRERPDGTLGDNYWTNLLGERVSTGLPSLAAAQRWKAARLLEGADPRRAAAEAATLEDAIREMYAELRRRGRAPGYISKAQQKLAHFPRLWGLDCKLADIDAAKVNAYITTRLGDRGARKGSTLDRLTLRDELGFLGQTLRLARRMGRYAYALEDVLPERWETGHKPSRDWCTPDALEKLLAHVEPRHAAHLLFFVVTAGRLSDSYRARAEDFDLERCRAHVRGSKTEGSLRTIPITDFLVPYAKRMLDGAEGEATLFLHWPNLHRDMREACARAGIPPVTTNGLRRTFGKWHRLHGYSLDTISKLFGHTTAKLVRDVYADVEGDELAAVMTMEKPS